jgi:hypothetical protein
VNDEPLHPGPDAAGNRPEPPSPHDPALPPPIPWPQLPPPLFTEPPPPSAAPPPAQIDPWAHRRGEPRLFAFLWSVYVLVAVAGSILWLARLPVITPSSYSPAARTLLVVLAMGMTVLWPMVRLSQAPPEGDSIGAALADLLVIQLPVQMVVWPMSFLANWPTRTVAAVSLLFVAWGVLTGGVLALAFAGGRPRPLPGRRAGPGEWSRAAWMGVCLLAVGAAPIAAMAARAAAASAPSWLAAASPFTAIYSISGSGWTGPTAPVRQPQWITVWGTAAVGAVLWIGSAVRASGGWRKVPRLH